MPYPIKPSDINTEEHFWNSFGHNETEVSARLLVRMAQEHGSWRNFTKEKIDKSSKQNFHFNKLLGDSWDPPTIIKNEKESYSFTHQFIASCFKSSPANKSL